MGGGEFFFFFFGGGEGGIFYALTKSENDVTVTGRWGKLVFGWKKWKHKKRLERMRTSKKCQEMSFFKNMGR